MQIRRIPFARKVEKVTADVVVADRLKAWIISNNLKPGDRLPTEQKLSEELGVARHTLREGIKRLSQLGIIGSRTGSGMYVKMSASTFLRVYALLERYRIHIV